MTSRIALATALAAACASRPPPAPLPSPAPPAPAPAPAPPAPPAVVVADDPPAPPSPCHALPPPPRCPDAAPCPVRAHAAAQCDGLWPTSIVASPDGTTAVASLRWSTARAATLLTFDDAGVTRDAPLPDAMGVIRLAATDGGLRVVSATQAAPSAVSSVVGAPGRELLPGDARIVLGASAGGGGRFDVLLAHGGTFPVGLHLATRAPDGAWTSLALGTSPWPYAALTHDAAGRPVTAWCSLAPGGRAVDLAARVGEAAPRVVLPRAACGDAALTAVTVGDALVLVYRATELRVVAPDGRGRHVELRVPDTAQPRIDTCPALTRFTSPDAPPRRCTARATGAAAHALVTTGGRAWVAWIEARLEVDLHVEPHCHPVDPVGPRVPRPHCEEEVTRLDDRSEAALVARPVVLGGQRPSLGEAVRVPLGRVPDGRFALLLDASGDAVHAVTAVEARGDGGTMHRLVLALPAAR
ncbi:MAG: hypothetical protein U0324_00450 [Polyangiales bacterium]